ncbi:MAG TPA: DUF2784 domain-containing protein [Candidatus Binataceae bacterium]|nr:DUF2784 domain-containing protein [Candidatus Binataceae bacterium]
MTQLANLVVALHDAYVAFVVLGLAAILVGAAAGWRWVRNLWFRSAHLAAIALVLFESIAGIACPLTTLENSLRARAGQPGYAGAFIGCWLDRLIFFSAPGWVFIALYAAFMLAVALTLWFVPPRGRVSNSSVAPASRS